MEEKKNVNEEIENVEITALNDDALEDVSGGPRLIVERTAVEPSSPDGGD